MRSEGSTRGRRVVWALAVACIVDSACSSREPAAPVRGSPTPAGIGLFEFGRRRGGRCGRQCRCNPTRRHGRERGGRCGRQRIALVVALTGGDYFECALISDGRVTCWGLNQDGELGKPSTFTCGSFPAPRGPISSRASPTLAPSPRTSRTRARSARTAPWSAGGTTPLARSAPPPRTCATRRLPTLRLRIRRARGSRAVAGVSGATAIAVASSSACAIVAGGAVQCWGDNGVGELGNGTMTSSMAPVTVSGLSELWP